MVKFLKKPMSMYTPSTGGWAFVYEKGNTIIILNTFLRCKDYTHEAIANAVWKENIRKYSGYVIKEQYSKINLNKLCFCIAVPLNKTKHISSIKRYINHIERKCNIPITRMKKIHTTKNDKVFMYFKANKIYIESPVLMHWLIAMLRSSICLNDYYKVKDFNKFLLKKNIKKMTVFDSKIIQWSYKEKVAENLMLFHKKYIKKIPLKRIYPKSIENPGTNYHNDFGMYSFKRDNLFSKAYKEATNKIIQEVGIKRD